MTHSDVQVSTTTSAIDTCRGGETGEVGAASGVDPRRPPSGRLVRQLAEVSGLGRKTVTVTVSATA